MFGYALAFTGYVLAIGTSEGRSLKVVVIWGLVFRGTLVLAEPSLSDDIFRYLWDGLVQVEGINPYRYAPSSDSLSGIGHLEILAQVNHPNLPTIYPPFAQLFYRACATVSPNIWSIKAAICLWDCLTLLFLSGLARSYDIPSSAVVIFFWNPLVLLEGAGHGHIDSVGVSLLVVSLLYLRLRGYGRAGAILGLAALTKFIPVLVLPAFWRWAGKAEANGRSTLVAMFTTRAILFPVAFLALVTAGYLCFLDVGWGVLGSFQFYASTWEFNALLYGLLIDVGVGGEAARLILGSTLVAAILAISINRMPPVQAAYYCVGAFLALTPTLHPWYVLWIIPFLCFYGNRGWIALSGLIVLAYRVLSRYRADGVWEEEAWVRWVIVGGALAAWLWPRLSIYLNKEEGEQPVGDPPSDQS